MFNTKSFLTIVLVAFSIFTSCKKDPGPGPEPDYARGFYIVNEGGFLQGNGSLSFYDIEKDSVFNDVFQSTNGRPLGDVFQSMTFYNGKGYLVVNNSQKIEVVDSITLQSLGTLTGLTSPRGIYFFENKAYVTDMVSNKVSVYNPETLTKIKDIPVGGWVEKMAFLKDTIYCTVQQFDYSDPTARKGILAIHPVLDTVVKYLEIREGAFDMVFDANYFLWVMCSGDFTTGKNGALYKVSTNEWKIYSEYELGSQAYYGSALKLSPNGLNLYFLLPDASGGFTESDLYRMNIFSNTLPTKPIYDGKDKYIYGYGFNELYGELYILDAIGGGQKGRLVRVDINTGQDLETYPLGYFPSNIVFR